MTGKEAPERVWRVAPYIHQHYKHGLSSWPVKEHAGDGATEYVRADLLTAAQAENVRLREALAETVEFFRGDPASDDYEAHDVLDRARAALQEGQKDDK